MGAAKGNKLDTLGTCEAPLDTCKQPVSLGEHTRFLHGHACSEWKLGLSRDTQTAPRLQESRFPKGKRLLFEAGPPILVHSQHESLQ